MGWSFPWVSSANVGSTSTLAPRTPRRKFKRPSGRCSRASRPPVFRHLATTTGTNVAGYLSEEPRFNAFALADGVVFHTYSTGAQGLEFLMGYYPILDRAPKGRAEEGESEFWIRRHDEYDQ
jgi:predicted dithiol-disulfide oxidoreductase (DUF899 family)